jgi:hypothetical protein
MAAQLIDEVLGARYCEVADDPYQVSLGPNNVEAAGDGRSRYNDTDDYHNFTAMPPEDPFGQPLGQGDESGDPRHPALRSPGNDFSSWRQRIEVYYVDPADPTVRRASTQPSDYRAVEVTIERIEPNGSVRPLATQRRVFCYVPIP